MSGLQKLLAFNALAGRELPALTEYTVTGNPAIFATNQSRPLTSFEIPLLAVQSGSGDPSPDNVRPITGWHGLTIINGTKFIPVEWEAEAGTIYGGVLDAVTGEMTITQRLYTLSGADSEGWTALSSSMGRYRFYSKSGDTGPTPGLDYGVNKKSIVAADYLVTAPNGTSSSYADYSGSIITGGTGEGNLVVAVDFATTAAGLKAYLAEHPLHIVGILSTPQTVQVPPVVVRTVSGDNTISTTTYGTNTVKYLKRG